MLQQRPVRMRPASRSPAGAVLVNEGLAGSFRAPKRRLASKAMISFLQGVQSESISPSTLGRLQANDPSAWERTSKLFSPLVFYWVLKAGVGREDA